MPQTQLKIILVSNFQTFLKCRTNVSDIKLKKNWQFQITQKRPEYLPLEIDSMGIRWIFSISFNGITKNKNQNTKLQKSILLRQYPRYLGHCNSKFDLFYAPTRSKILQNKAQCRFLIKARLMVQKDVNRHKKKNIYM